MPETIRNFMLCWKEKNILPPIKIIKDWMYGTWLKDFFNGRYKGKSSYVQNRRRTPKW